MNKKLFLAVISVCFPLAVLWARTGLVPAASGGDEVWWSESGYHFMHEGILRWAFLNDDKGSAILSFWPPVSPLLQALSMRTFGMNAFGMCAQSSLVSTLIMLGVFLLCRKLALDRAKALFASVAIFGLLMVDRRLTMVGMANLTALAAVIYAVLIITFAEKKDLQSKLIPGIFAGLTLGVGLFSYYPQSPFLLLACLAAVLALGELTAWTAFSIGIGMLPVIAAAAIWIGPHWPLFENQVLHVGVSHYFSLRNPFAALPNDSTFSWGVTLVQTLEGVSVFLLSIFGLAGAKTRSLKMVAAMTLCLSLPMFVYKDSPQVAAGVLGVVLIFGLLGDTSLTGVSPGTWSRLFKVAASFLVLLAEIKFALIGMTAYWQRQGRNYSEVGSELRQSVKPGGPVAICQSAWLGLREVIPSNDLYLLVYAGPSLENMAMAAKQPNADDYFAYLVVDRDLVGPLEKVYPWVKRGIETGKFHVEKEITPPFKPLPWALNSCYDVIVYKRTNASP